MLPFARVYVELVLMQEHPPVFCDQSDRFENKLNLFIGHEIGQTDAGETWLDHFVGGMVFPSNEQEEENFGEFYFSNAEKRSMYSMHVYIPSLQQDVPVLLSQFVVDSQKILGVRTSTGAPTSGLDPKQIVQQNRNVVVVEEEA